MPKVKVNNVELFYNEFGKGKETLLFSHGFLVNNTMFQGQIDRLKDKYRCISYDHRGHGNSEVTPNGYELDNLVTDAVGLIEKLNIAPVHFIGMSTGGFVGMRIAIRRPDLLKSLILMNTSAEEEPKLPLLRNNILLLVVKYLGWFPVISQVMPIMFHRSFLKDKSRQQEIEKWKKIVTNQNRKVTYPFGKAIFGRDNVLDKLSKIDIPTAILISDKDIVTTPKYSKRMLETIPNALYFSIPDAGHFAAIEKPNEVANSMEEFYNKIVL